MMNFFRNMRQLATYWEKDSTDGFGNFSFNDAIIINCRWQTTAVLFRDHEGRELVSDSIIYTNHDVTVGSYIMLGESEDYDTDPRRVTGAFEIRKVDISPNILQIYQLIKAYV